MATNLNNNRNGRPTGSGTTGTRPGTGTGTRPGVGTQRTAAGRTTTGRTGTAGAQRTVRGSATQRSTTGTRAAQATARVEKNQSQSAQAPKKSRRQRSIARKRFLGVTAIIMSLVIGLIPRYTFAAEGTLTVADHRGSTFSQDSISILGGGLPTEEDYYAHVSSSQEYLKYVTGSSYDSTAYYESLGLAIAINKTSGSTDRDPLPEVAGLSVKLTLQVNDTWNPEKGEIFLWGVQGGALQAMECSKSLVGGKPVISFSTNLNDVQYFVAAYKRDEYKVTVTDTVFKRGNSIQTLADITSKPLRSDIYVNVLSPTLTYKDTDGNDKSYLNDVINLIKTDYISGKNEPAYVLFALDTQYEDINADPVENKPYTGGMMYQVPIPATAGNGSAWDLTTGSAYMVYIPKVTDGSQEVAIVEQPINTVEDSGVTYASFSFTGGQAPSDFALVYMYRPELQVNDTRAGYGSNPATATTGGDFDIKTNYTLYLRNLLAQDKGMHDAITEKAAEALIKKNDINYDGFSYYGVSIIDDKTKKIYPIQTKKATDPEDEKINNWNIRLQIPINRTELDLSAGKVETYLIKGSGSSRTLSFVDSAVIDGNTIEVIMQGTEYADAGGDVQYLVVQPGAPKIIPMVENMRGGYTDDPSVLEKKVKATTSNEENQNKTWYLHVSTPTDRVTKANIEKAVQDNGLEYTDLEYLKIRLTDSSSGGNDISSEDKPGDEQNKIGYGDLSITLPLPNDMSATKGTINIVGLKDGKTFYNSEDFNLKAGDPITFTTNWLDLVDTEGSFAIVYNAEATLYYDIAGDISVMNNGGWNIQQPGVVTGKISPTITKDRYLRLRNVSSDTGVKAMLDSRPDLIWTDRAFFNLSIYDENNNLEVADYEKCVLDFKLPKSWDADAQKIKVYELTDHSGNYTVKEVVEHSIFDGALRFTVTEPGTYMFLYQSDDIRLYYDIKNNIANLNNGGWHITDEGNVTGELKNLKSFRWLRMENVSNDDGIMDLLDENQSLQWTDRAYFNLSIYKDSNTVPVTADDYEEATINIRIPDTWDPTVGTIKVLDLNETAGTYTIDKLLSNWSINDGMLQFTFTDPGPFLILYQGEATIYTMDQRSSQDPVRIEKLGTTKMDSQHQPTVDLWLKIRNLEPEEYNAADGVKTLMVADGNYDNNSAEIYYDLSMYTNSNMLDAYKLDELPNATHTGTPVMTVTIPIPDEWDPAASKILAVNVADGALNKDVTIVNQPDEVDGHHYIELSTTELGQFCLMYVAEPKLTVEDKRLWKTANNLGPATVMKGTATQPNPSNGLPGDRTLTLTDESAAEAPFRKLIKANTSTFVGDVVPFHLTYRNNEGTDVNDYGSIKICIPIPDGENPDVYALNSVAVPQYDADGNVTGYDTQQDLVKSGAEFSYRVDIDDEGNNVLVLETKRMGSFAMTFSKTYKVYHKFDGTDEEIEANLDAATSAEPKQDYILVVDEIQGSSNFVNLLDTEYRSHLIFDYPKENYQEKFNPQSEESVKYFDINLYYADAYRQGQKIKVPSSEFESVIVTMPLGEWEPGKEYTITTGGSSSATGSSGSGSRTKTETARSRVEVLSMQNNALDTSITSTTQTDKDPNLVKFKTTHFTEYALVYLEPTLVEPVVDPSSNTSNSSSTSGSNNSSNTASTASTARSGASNSASTGSTNNTSNNSSTASSGLATLTAAAGISGNSGTGTTDVAGTGSQTTETLSPTVNNATDMPKTGDADVYRYILEVMLFLFGAFELISSMSTKKKVKTT